jgi:hypothetical protein
VSRDDAGRAADILEAIDAITYRVFTVGEATKLMPDPRDHSRPADTTGRRLRKDRHRHERTVGHTDLTLPSAARSGEHADESRIALRARRTTAGS